MQKIVITTSSFNKENTGPLENCSKKYEIILNPFDRKLETSELVNLASGALGIIAGTEKYDRATLDKLPSLKVISRCGTGLDSIDCEYAKKRAIIIYNTPDGPTTAVAELTIGLMLSLLRKIALMDREIRKKKWAKHMGYLLQGKKVGIIGSGKIGKKVAELLGAFNVEIAHCDCRPMQCPGTSGQKSLDDLLRWADIVTLHCNSDKKGEFVIGKREINLMNEGAFLINTARGNILDESALEESFKSGHLGGAALDVFLKEPYEGPLTCYDNVILAPHIGSYAFEARMKMEFDAAENLARGLQECSLCEKK
ncbi:MAG: phosphoglycerate dehydrogenase [Vulcanimicrobiota bacterium]